MIHIQLRMFAVTLCLVGAWCANASSEERSHDSKAIEGLWSGSWGGGEADGVIYQPVLAKLFISANRIEMSGIRHVDRLSGTVRLDSEAKRMQITATVEKEERLQPKAIQYTYELKGDELTLIGSDNLPISFTRIHVVRDPLCNVRVEFVEATGINQTGELLVRRFTVLEAGHAGVRYHQPENGSLDVKQATVRLMRESGWENQTIDEARKKIGKSASVVLAFRNDDRVSPQHDRALWKKKGSPQPDSEEVWRTCSRILRPGTLVFVLPASEKVSPP